ncbi:histidine phosphatase family protein [Chachezhania sediminis]|uniref:histidine phosphatase family protein n=1 Tax=Chachezhania sediminis TaxID=2599291 RepID=UPI00131D270E|nr:histidine phosphatase family protein [Chachezhania sediminis]
MSHITLVRHGQANTGARTEEEYDRLSDLGAQQAAWLGRHLEDTQQYHHRIYCGTLHRQVQTAAAMGLEAEVVQDPRLNELAYFDLARLAKEQHGLKIPAGREEFVLHMPQVFAFWAEDRIDDAPERFADFETRVQAALAEIHAGDGPALVVTSSGVIANALRQAMELSPAGMARMALAIMNTSVHRLFPIGAQLSPVLFNAVPHLEAPDRAFAQTHL